LWDLVEVLHSAGQHEESAAVFEAALARYERKENLVMAERVQARPAELRSAETAVRSPMR
jgi:hypothetical protein